MKKPEQKQISYYEYRDIQNYLEQKYDVNLRDFKNKHLYFNRWCIKKGYTGTDPEGKTRNDSLIWFAEYKEDPEGMLIEPPYENFWHWFIDIYDVHNGKLFCVDLKEALEEGEPPQFVCTILNWIIKDFGHNLCIRTSW